MLFSQEELHDMVPFASDRTIMEVYKHLVPAMEEFDIVTPLRIAAFIAQITHESGSFHYREEIASGANYEFREDLGNLEFEAMSIAHANYSTTGRFYKGHGFIQITGYYNHVAVAEALGIDCVHKPKLLCNTDNACRSAAWFWKSRELNTLADQGRFKRITKIINGGFNGLKDRLENYRRCKKVLNIPSIPKSI
jgi:putative chitinase